MRWDLPELATGAALSTSDKGRFTGRGDWAIWRDQTPGLEPVATSDCVC